MSAASNAEPDPVDMRVYQHASQPVTAALLAEVNDLPPAFLDKQLGVAGREG